MEEQFLTLMADLDDASQRRMGEWYQSLKAAGFTGTQTPLPYHISLSTFPLEKEREAVERMKKAAAAFPRFPCTSVISAFFRGAGFCLARRKEALN